LWVLCAVLTATDSSAADVEAVERMARGDHDAVGDLYDRHGRSVYSLALRVLRDQSDAEEVVQEVFSQAWRQAQRYDRRRGSVIAWLLTVARSRAIDRLRGRKARPEPAGDETLLGDLPATDQPPDEQAVWAGQAARIRGALEGISALQRVAIELAFFEGLTHAEISERLELPLGTVKTRIRQGLLTLRDRLAGAHP
jgi:RNA polymerase sigma-70 factor, ECF subfamily